MKPSPSSPRSTLRERVETLLAEQRQLWHAGRARPVEQLLADQPALAADDEAAVDLIYQEFVLRTELGPPPTSEEYFRRFPRHKKELEAQLKFLQAVQALAAKWTQVPARSRNSHPAPDWSAVEGFEVYEELGRGSMGVVYRARQNSLGRQVALKVIHPTRAREPEAQARFRQEAAAVARLQDPHIVQIHDVGEQDGRLFFAMELVEGVTLERCLTSGPLPDRQAAQLVETLARTMQHAHDRGIVHRDLKPANILLQGKQSADYADYTDKKDHRLSSSVKSVKSADDLLPKITDFGLARCREDDAHLTETGAVLGTPSYMAPEQAVGGGRGAGPAADVYALGAILYECLTGRPPFQAATPLETLRQAASDEPLAPSRLQPSVPRDLDTICLKCLEKEPGRRYAGARALADDLGRYLRGAALAARPVGRVERVGRWCRRNPSLAGMTALLVLVVLGGLGGIVYEWRQSVVARGAAELSDAQTQELLGEFIDIDPAIPLRDTGFEGSHRKEPLLKAEAQCERLLEKRPDDLSLRIALTRVRGGLARVYAQHGQVAEEEACLQRARDLWEPLVRRDPRHEARAWLATTLNAQTCFQIEEGYYLPALDLALRAEALWDNLLAEEPANVWYLQRASEQQVTNHALATVRPAVEALRRPLQERQADLRRQLAADPGDARCARGLATVSYLLGELYFLDPSPAASKACFQEAADLYRRSLSEHDNRLLDVLRLAHLCLRLMDGRRDDPHYREAIARFEQAGARAGQLAQNHPENGWLQAVLMSSQLSVALCHWRVGETARAEAVLRNEKQRLQLLSRAPYLEAGQKITLASMWVEVAGNFRLCGQQQEALTLAREVAGLNQQIAQFPWRDLGYTVSLTGLMINTSGLLRQVGDPAEALRQAEQARRLSEGLCQAVPDSLIYRMQLANAACYVGKAEWELGHAREAVAAFVEAAAVLRFPFEQAPSLPAYRLNLSRAYDRVVYWGGLAGERAAAAEALREREKLWPGDPVMLRKEAKDFRELADFVAAGKDELSVADETEWQQYLDESARCERAAAAVERR